MAKNDAVIYTRISRDVSGESIGVTRQEKDCLDLARTHSLNVVKVFTDNDISASTISRKTRPGFQEMLAEVRKGDIGTVLAYSNSRLTRRPLELEDLIKLHEATGVVFKTVVSGEDDLSSADGRMVARLKSSIDAAEAERTAERLKAAHRHLAINGKPFTGGSRAFGWEKDKVTVVHEEAELLRSAARSIIRGPGSLTGIADSWNALGIQTPKGRLWTHKSVKDVLTNPRVGGYRVYHNEIMVGPDGEKVRGTWEPILSDDEYEALLAELRTRSRARRKPTKHLLSPLLMCGRCGSKMIGTTGNAISHYRCARQWHLTISLHSAEQAVYEKVALRMAQIAHYTKNHAPVQRVTHTAFPDEARLELLQRQNEELMEHYNQGKLNASRVFPQVEKNDQEIGELIARRREWTAEVKRKSAPPAELGDFDLSVWTHLFSKESKDALVSMGCERIVVKPAGKNRSVTTRDRISIVWTPFFTPWPEGEEPAHRQQDLDWMDDHASQSVEAKAEIPLSERLKRTLELVEANPLIVGREVAESLGISRPYAQKLLREAKTRRSSEDGTSLTRKTQVAETLAQRALEQALATELAPPLVTGNPHGAPHIAPPDSQ